MLPSPSTSLALSLLGQLQTPSTPMWEEEGEEDDEVEKKKKKETVGGVRSLLPPRVVPIGDLHLLREVVMDIAHDALMRRGLLIRQRFTHHHVFLSQVRSDPRAVSVDSERAINMRIATAFHCNRIPMSR
ncbi:hypothetical protein E2C01_011976 [Portunus trituberculatus]|uniref:Uncharacterized protein n=1 Tax=Portunus trituberculatus TaxID=210409 RepID=A0A5B7DCL5_PORTR|nr:hypothetical protein [Portunus trituberculatus]